MRSPGNDRRGHASAAALLDGEPEHRRSATSTSARRKGTRTSNMPPCHDHYHFLGFAAYVLKRRDGTAVAAGRKVSFCLEDIVRWDRTARQNYAVHLRRPGHPGRVERHLRQRTARPVDRHHRRACGRLQPRGDDQSRARPAGRRLLEQHHDHARDDRCAPALTGAFTRDRSAARRNPPRCSRHRSRRAGRALW